MPATDRAVEPFPSAVSILVAARNEESTILNCLWAIAGDNHTQSGVEVLIGNDGSTDQTAVVSTDFIADKPHFKLIDVTTAVAGLRGKANVLAQLARQARGQYLLFTDADTRVPPGWAATMQTEFTPSTHQPIGIVTGVTLPDGPKLFHKLQAIDWLYSLTLTHLVSSAGIPVTAMGNNMAVSREAYDAVGGYEALPFSVVEDYTLFRAITQQGYGFRNLLSERVLARTRPVDTLGQLLNQRKRWMRGATALPGWMVVLLYGQYLAGPLLLLLGGFAPVFAVGLYLTRLLVQTLVISFGISRLRQTRLWPFALLFEIYQLLIGPLAVVYDCLPVPIRWKERTYQ